ncbi:MAG: ribosomal protein S6 [Candidatus Azotimanducaceae bacterium]|jgi:ribosomal protein S6
MAETKMPAAEAVVEASLPGEKSSYEFAFHVLPTVAEGEVQSVFEGLKDIITKDGGELFDEEAPERFDLAYDIVQHMEGKNRKFSSAYFGWVRFTATPDKITTINVEMDHRTDLLRHLLIKLTKAEEAQPFLFHEALGDQKMVTTVDESKVVPETKTETKTEEPAEAVETTEVKEETTEAAEKKES